LLHLLFVVNDFNKLIVSLGHLKEIVVKQIFKN